MTPVMKPEQAILTILKHAVSVDNASAVQTAAAQCLLSLYDRKVTRERFIADASLCIMLYMTSGRAMLLTSLMNAETAPPNTAEFLGEVRADVVEVMQQIALSLSREVELLLQCPDKGDAVN
jgi:hypothetical protein